MQSALPYSMDNVPLELANRLLFLLEYMVSIWLQLRPIHRCYESLDRYWHVVSGSCRHG
jgi:hypothetical protein